MNRPVIEKSSSDESQIREINMSPLDSVLELYPMPAKSLEIPYAPLRVKYESMPKGIENSQ
jgi:hypothetical protein